jgi:hypothetical protein
MAISTYPITLKAAGTKLCDIKDFPDLGGAPEMLETTTLSDEAKTYIAGIQDQQALEFTANYTATAYAAVNALTTTTAFTLEFGTGGASGIFSWSGTASAYIVGAGVNEVVDMKIVIVPSTAITKS